MKLRYELRVVLRACPEQGLAASAPVFRSRRRELLEKQAALWAKHPAYVSHEIVERAVIDRPVK